MKYLLRWLYAAVPVTLVLLGAYILVQQEYRESLNDPQVQMAEDASSAIADGAQPDQVVPTGKVDIRDSLAPWVAVYTNAGVPLIASGQLDGAPPTLPQGVFDTSSWLRHENGRSYNQSPIPQDRFTWQPEPGVRVAVVLTHVESPNGIVYVASGRSMREGEQRIEHAGEIAFFVWVVTLFSIAVLQLGAYVLEQRSARAHSRRG